MVQYQAKRASLFKTCNGFIERGGDRPVLLKKKRLLLNRCHFEYTCCSYPQLSAFSQILNKVNNDRFLYLAEHKEWNATLCFILRFSLDWKEYNQRHRLFVFRIALNMQTTLTNSSTNLRIIWCEWTLLFECTEKSFDKFNFFFSCPWFCLFLRCYVLIVNKSVKGSFY